MKVNRSLRPDSGPALTGRDLISFEHSLKDEIARFLPFESYSLYFPDSLDASSGVWEDLVRGLAVHLPEEKSILVPLMHGKELLGVFVARGVRIPAPKTLPPFIARMAGLVLDKLALYKASITDSLTGLANRERFVARVAEEIELVRECILPGSGASMDPDSSCYSAGFGVVMARLGELERLYERHGRDLGDEAASMAAQAFAAHCPDRALCARTGPDLLAMLLPGGAEGQCREIADAAARDLSEVLVSEPVLEHSMDLGPSLGVATYPRDLDGGLSAPGAADQALTIMRRAEYAARVASEHGPGTVFSHEDVKARGGRVMNVLAGGRVTVDLGRAAGAFEGERYLVRDSENAQGVKGEVVLLEVDENESMAEVVHAADPWTPIEPGDGLALVRGKDSSVAQTDGPPQVDERSGLYSYAGFMDLLSRKREIPERFALFLTELPLRAEETDDRALARAASAASEIFGDRADGGRFSLAGMIHFVPEISRQKAKSLAHRLHKKLSGDFGDSVIGVSTHPYLSFLPADALDNCRKAVEYARLLPAPRVGLIDSLALTIAADKLFTAGRLFDAVEGYKLALLADRSNTLARNSLGVGLARAGRLSEAARHFKTVINRDESDVNALYNFGYACLRMGKHDEAENAFRRCLELKPDHVYALVRLGRIALADGRFDKAEKMLGKAESLEGGQGLTSRHLARLALARGRKDEAREHLHQAMIHDPRDAQAMHLMAELYLEEGEDPQIAEALARQSAAIRPEHKPFLKTLARSLEALGKGEEAAAVRARSGSL